MGVFVYEAVLVARLGCAPRSRGYEPRVLSYATTARGKHYTTRLTTDALSDRFSSPSVHHSAPL